MKHQVRSVTSIWTVLAIVICLGAKTTAKPFKYEPPPEIPSSFGIDIKELSNYVETLLKKIGTSPGVAVAVVQGEQIRFIGGFGYRDLKNKLPVTPQTEFYIASTTKSFTGTAAKILADEKLIDLDVPIKTYFPDLVLSAPLSTEHISLRDLLTHRSGIRNDAIALRTAYTGQHDPDTILRLLANHSRVISPSYQYSNLGYIVAALAMERAAKEPWQLILEKRLFGPLGMKNTTAYMTKARSSGNFALPYRSTQGSFTELPIKDDQTMHAAGGIVSSAEDLSNWLIFNMNQGRFRGKQIMSPISLEEVHSPQINQRRSFYEFERYAYGLGWNLGTYKGEKLIHCFGEFAGYRPHVSFMPEHGIGVVVLVNESNESGFLPDLIAADIYDHLLSKQPLRVDPNPRVQRFLNELQKERETDGSSGENRKSDTARVQMSASSEAYAGSFESDELGSIVVSFDGKNLHATFGSMTSQLAHQTADTFQVDFKLLSPVNLSFKLSEGSVTELSLIGRTFVRK